MDPLGDPLTTRTIQTGWEFTTELYPSGQFGCIDDLDCQFGNGLVWTRTWTWSEHPERLLTLLPGPDWASLEEAIERVWRCTWRPWFSGFGDMHLEAIIKQVWRYTGRPWQCEIGDVLGGSWWMAYRMLRLFSSVSYLAIMGLWQGDLIIELTRRAGLMMVDRVGRHATTWSYIHGLTHNHGNKEKTNCLG